MNKKDQYKASQGELFPMKKPDLSNLLKMIEDCLTACGFWLDDSQVVKYISPAKKYASIPGWNITIIEVET